ncbi:MAG: hypothetical protein K2X80_13900 [Pseudomonadaceae bacterium]|nr:hypothetical protein [Pseudomonadaceae bacterium]
MNCNHHPELEFDAATHSYSMGGVKLPGVTSTLKPLSTYDDVPASILAAASARGTAVHLATELEDLETLDYASLDDEVTGYLIGYQRFKEVMRPEFLGIEQFTYHKTLKYAGMYDRELILHGMKRAKRAILDLKSCVTMMPTTGPQTAAYLAAVNSHRPKTEHAIDRFGLKLGRDGTFELVPYTSDSDLHDFMSCLRVLRFKHEHHKFFKQLATEQN